ncbi:MAG: GNAT family N-acetyltransferase [Bacteroidales bacterium]|jgi:predicted GNAT family N-acyltransferase|nr:GNAT family N-acetyltransferase [Bacteroidales bacterium]
MSLGKVEQLEWDIARLTQDTPIHSFDCGKDDLNKFLKNDAKKYLNDLFAVTYVLQTNTETIAYFSLSNDRIARIDVSKTEWNRLSRSVANNKRKKSHPAVKIGRLAVNKKSAQVGFGRIIVFYVKKLYAETLQTAGCRFITVDAYAEVTDFYEKNGFKFMTETDKDEETRAMYFDLKTI